MKSNFHTQRLVFTLTAVFLFFTLTEPAFAGPLAAIVPIVVGALKVSTAVKLALTLAATLAMSALQKNKRATSPGILIERTLDGGTNPRTILAGLYATSGSNLAPPISYGNAGKTPNAYLAKLIALADYPVDGLSRIIVDGEYISLTHQGNGRYLMGGKYSGLGEVFFMDGRQTTANATLVSRLNVSPRPWTSARIGKGVSYVCVIFKYEPEIIKSEPELRFEVRGARFYDPRKDTSVGGSGAHRWNDTSTWEYTTNNVVIIYNILRGITLADGTVYGGRATSPEQLPLTNWVAGMNVCDENVGIAKRFQGGFEWALDQEPADVIDEFKKGCEGEIIENGGIYKIRVGGPGLPVMFLTDDDFLFDEAEELDPFPGIQGSINTVRATFPHPEVVWQQHDAPILVNPDYVEADEGVELVADIQLPAVPYPMQVQRIMRAWLEDDRRWVRHVGTLSHRAFALEPMDVISWTSQHNNYAGKLFDITQTDLSLYNLQQAIAMREVDPNDWIWDPDFELPDDVPTGGTIEVEEQSVEDFAVMPWTIRDNDSVERRPAIRATWDIEGASDATAVRIQVRVASNTELVADITVANVGEGAVIISEGILPAVGYEVRARYLVDRPTLWTIWHGVTVANIRLTDADFNFDAIVESLGESVVLPQITKPLKDTMLGSLIGQMKQHSVNRTVRDRSQANRAAVFQEQFIRRDDDVVLVQRIDGLEASMITDDEVGTIVSGAISSEASIRLAADSALAGRLDTVEASYLPGGAIAVAINAAVSEETLARAAADGALAGRLTTVEATFNPGGVGANAISAAVSSEAVARANADSALAGTVTAVSARLNNMGGSGVTVEQLITASANDIDGLQGQYTLRINSNGRITGFGLATGATGSEFSILADRFIVVDPSNNSVGAYPFQIIGGAVYIRKALIQQITADQISVGSLSAVSSVMGDIDIRPMTGATGRLRCFDEFDVIRVELGRIGV